MSMNTKNNDQDDIVADINMTPLIDIMLVLLIIFMVSSSAALDSGLDVNLPEVSQVGDKSEATMLILSLTKSGDVAIQGEKVDKSQLKEKISALLVELKTDTVILEGDGESQLEAAMELMDIAKSAGAKNFSIAARQKN
jgi:biopolymer transport protein ExbD